MKYPANNDFLLVSQFSVTGALYTCRPDLVGFVNGLPLVVIELKKPGVPARAAFDENLTNYRERIDTSPDPPHEPQGRARHSVRAVSALPKPRRARSDAPYLHKLIQGFNARNSSGKSLPIEAERETLFSEHKAGLVKIIGQNHQFLGVNNAIASMREARS